MYINTAMLIGAANEIFGMYSTAEKKQERGVRKSTHEILEDTEKRNIFGVAIFEALQAIKEEEVATKAGPNIGFHRTVGAGLAVLEQVNIDVSISDVATSELDPNWVLIAEPEEVLALAAVLVNCREITRKCMTERLDELSWKKFHS